MAKLPAKEEMLQYKYNVPATDWMNTPVAMGSLTETIP